MDSSFVGNTVVLISRSFDYLKLNEDVIAFINIYTTIAAFSY